MPRVTLYQFLRHDHPPLQAIWKAIGWRLTGRCYLDKSKWRWRFRGLFGF